MTKVYRSPSPSNLPEQECSGLGERVALGLRAPGGDIHEVVHRLGGRIHEALYSSDRLIVHEAGDFDVLLPAYGGTFENQGRIAQALGHYFLQFPLLPQESGMVVSGSSEGWWVFQEARAFARGFLLPSATLQRQMEASGGIAVDVARALGVEAWQIEQRLGELDLAS